MGTWTITAEGQEVLTVSGQYAIALECEEDEAAHEVDRLVGKIAQRVLARGVNTEADLVTLALAARHFDNSDEQQAVDWGRSAFQNGLMPHVVVDEVLRLAGDRIVGLPAV